MCGKLRMAGFAARNLFRRPGRSLLAGGTVAACVFAATVLAGVTGGFRAAAEAGFLRTAGGRIFLRAVERDDEGKPRTVPLGADAFDALLAPFGDEIALVSKRNLAKATVHRGGKEQVQILRGVDWEAESKALSGLGLLRGSLAGMAGSRGIVVNARTAEALGADVGDEVKLRVRAVDGEIDAAPFRVAAIAADTGAFATIDAFLDAGALARLLHQPEGSAARFAVLPGPRARPDLARRIHAAAREAGMQVLPWPARPGSGPVRYDDEDARIRRMEWEGTAIDFHDDGDLAYYPLLLLAIAPAAEGLLLAVLLGVSAAGLASAFALGTQERRRELGTLRAIGFRKADVAALVSAEGAALAAAGCAAGIGAAAAALAGIGLIDFGPGSPIAVFLEAGRLVPRADPGAVGMAAAAAFAATVASSAPAAARAAAVEPARAFAPGAEG